MRMIVVALLLAATVLLTGTEAQAQYRSSYTFRDGYYWNSAGQAFSRARTRYWTGCNWAYRYSYSPVKVDPYTDDAVSRLLAIAKARDAWVGRMNLEGQRHELFKEKLKALGMEGSFSWDGHQYRLQQNYDYSNYSQGNYTPYAQQGQTVYGMMQLSQSYQPLDKTLAMKQASDLTLNAQNLAGQGHSNLLSAMQAMSEHDTVVAQIIAKAELLRAAEPRRPNTTGSYYFRAETNGQGRTQVEKVPTDEIGGPGYDYEQLFAVLKNRCIACHGPDDQKGGLDLQQFLVMDWQKRREILRRVTLPKDHPEHMPKGGDMLPPEEMQQLFCAPLRKSG